MDTAFRSWSSTLAASQFSSLPLDLHAWVRVVRSMCLPAALHGIEASLLASDSLRKLRSSIHKVVWSRRQPLAGVGAVLSLLDEPTGCDPLFCVVWFRFRLLRRYLALWPAEAARVYRLLEMAGEACPGHGPVHLLSTSAAEIGFRWNPDRVRLVISRLALVFVLPLDFLGKVRVVKSMYLPAAWHGIEVSLLASESLRKLRSAVRRVVWSRRQPLANVGAVLGLLDGPTRCDPAFCVVWFRFRLLRRYLALWPAEVGRVYRLLAKVHEGCPGHGPVHLLSASASEIGFQWDPHALAWVRPGCC